MSPSSCSSCARWNRRDAQIQRHSPNIAYCSIESVPSSSPPAAPPDSIPTPVWRAQCPRSLLFVEATPSVPLFTAEPSFKPLIYTKFTFAKSTFSRKSRRKSPIYIHVPAYHTIIHRERETQEFADLSPRDVYRGKLRWQ